MSGYTPGPWKAKFSFPGLNPGIGDTWQIDCDGHAVCTTQFCYAPDTEANARLIAAAPCLLAALRELLAQAEGPVMVHGDGIGWSGVKDGLSGDEFRELRKRRLADARAALAQAEGN